MEFVYVLLVNNNINGAGLDNDAWVFDTLEKAQKVLEEYKQNFLKDVGNDIDNYVIDEDSVDGLGTFIAYEDGFYNENYFELTIYQREVE